MQLYFESYETKIFLFKVPPLSKFENRQNKSILITAAPFLPGTKDLLLTASTKSHVTANSASKRGVPAWSKGQVLRLSEQLPEDWCADCTITIMVDVVDGGYYHISAKTFLQEQQLIIDKKLDDAAYDGDLQCYTYKQTHDNRDIKLSLTQYSGMISLYVNPEEKGKPNNIDSQYSLTGTDNSQLIIPVKDRNTLSKSKGYYVCAFPHLPSSYSLLAQEIEPNLEFSYIDDGFTQKNSIQGKNMQLLMYKVPSLDISKSVNLDFQLSAISGNLPIMAVQFCDELEHQKCTKDLYKEFVTDPSGKFQKAKGNDQAIRLSLDHKQQYCKEKFNNECYYMVAVIGTSDNQNIASYQLNVYHSQQGHIMLQESKQITDTVNNREYKYYKFTLIESQKVKYVTFIMNTLHGDSDIFISRKTKNPRQYEFEKSSQQSLGVMDMVSFDGKNLATTYYIGVYGYQYSTYNLMVQVEREDENNNNINIPLLMEGIPIKGRISNKLKTENYKFEVKMQQGFEKSIRIHLSPFEGKLKIYASYGSPVTKKAFQWSSDNNLIVINTADSNYHREGTYYIMIEPAYTIWELLYQMKYTYMISYSTEQQFTYLQASTSLDFRQNALQTNYFRHFISEPNKDMKMSLTVFGGQPQVYIGINPNNKWPNKDKNDIPLNSKIGYTYSLPATKLQQANPSCIDQAISSEQACAIYVGVECKEECQYTIKLSYDNSLPHQLMMGMPQHDTVRQGEYNYYYISINRNDKIKDVYAVLTTLSGNADLYMKFQPDSSQKDIAQWALPTENSYDLKSTEKLSQDIIRIKQSDLEKCFQNTNKDADECTLQLGVYGYSQNENNKNSGKEILSSYNIVVYIDVAFLQNDSPMSNQVEQGEYKYFIYQASCHNCSLLISLSTIGSGDPDLFIVYGDQRLPTKNDYDIASATYKSEVIEINLNHEFFTKNKIKSMKGNYLVAVYGSKNSTFTLSVSQDQHPMVQLKEGLSVKRSQEKYDLHLYKWQNWDEQDIKITLNVMNGYADLYISTFDAKDTSQNLISRIPNTKRNVKWVQENIQSISSNDEKSILIKNKDRNYCAQCLYMIGVATHEKDCEYNLVVEKLDANFANSMFLRTGEKQYSKLKQGMKKIYKFMIDEKATLRMQYQVLAGRARLELQKTDKPFQEFLYAAEGSFSFSMNPDDPNFIVEQMYYVVVTNIGENDAEIELFIQTDRTVIRLKDGEPLYVVFDGQNDISKYFVFDIPEGDSTVQLQIKSKREAFYPTLYYKFYENLESEISKIDFPPGGDPEFKKIENWDKALGILQIQIPNQGVKGNKAGIAVSLFESSWLRQYHTNDPIFITASYSPIVNMALNTMQIGKFQHETSFKIYKIDSPQLRQKGYFFVEFAECFGETDLMILSQPNAKDPSNIIQHNQWNENGKKIFQVTLPQQSLYVYVTAKEYKLSLTGLLTTDYLIKGFFGQEYNRSGRRYTLQNEGKIEYEMLSPTSIEMKWGALQYFVAPKNNNNTENNLLKKNATQVTYHLIESNLSRARLDTICALRKEMIEEFGYRVMQSVEPFFTLSYEEPGKELLFNVIAQIYDDSQEGELLPYQPITIQIGQAQSQSYFSGFAFWLYTIFFAVCFALTAIYFFRKRKITVEKQVEYEMADVRGQGAGYQGVASENSFAV